MGQPRDLGYSSPTIQSVTDSAESDPGAFDGGDLRNSRQTRSGVGGCRPRSPAMYRNARSQWKARSGSSVKVYWSWSPAAASLRFALTAPPVVRCPQTSVSDRTVRRDALGVPYTERVCFANADLISRAFVRGCRDSTYHLLGSHTFCGMRQAPVHTLSPIGTTLVPGRSATPGTREW